MSRARISPFHATTETRPKIRRDTISLEDAFRKEGIDGRRLGRVDAAELQARVDVFS